MTARPDVAVGGCRWRSGLRRLSAHPRPRAGRRSRHTDVPVHRPCAGRPSQSRLSPLCPPDLPIFVSADRIAGVPHQSLLGDLRRPHGVVGISHRSTAGMPADRQCGGGSRHGLRPYLLVAGNHCRGLYARLRNHCERRARTAGLWNRTGRAGFFLRSDGIFAAGLGNHTTIVGFAPGMAVFAVVDRTDSSFYERAPWPSRRSSCSRGCCSTASSSFGLVNQARTSNRERPRSRQLVDVMRGKAVRRPAVCI